MADATEAYHDSGKPLLSELAVVIECMWQMPISTFALWWNAGVEAFWSHPHHPHHPHHAAVSQEEYDQLVVPEPLEVTGEHALFA